MGLDTEIGNGGGGGLLSGVTVDERGGRPRELGILRYEAASLVAGWQRCLQRGGDCGGEDKPEEEEEEEYP
jgi:hypothetical protein